MKSPYGNPYAKPTTRAAKAEAARRRQSLMMHVAIWSSVPATVVAIAAVFASQP